VTVLMEVDVITSGGDELFEFGALVIPRVGDLLTHTNFNGPNKGTRWFEVEVVQYHTSDCSGKCLQATLQVRDVTDAH
jgi:hypothetical protein